MFILSFVIKCKIYLIVYCTVRVVCFYSFNTQYKKTLKGKIFSFVSPVFMFGKIFSNVFDDQNKYLLKKCSNVGTIYGVFYCYRSRIPTQ